MGFSKHLGCCSTIKADVRAVLRGLKIAREMCTHKLWVRLDSTAVVIVLSNQNSGHPEYQFLIQQCQQLLGWGGWEVRISHYFREANQVADKLANIGTMGELGVQIFRVPPKEAHKALYADCMGVSWPRRFHD